MQFLNVDFIKEYLKQNHLSAWKLSKKAGLDPSLLGRSLNGYYPDPRVETIEKLAKAMNIQGKDIYKLLILHKDLC